MLVLSRQRNESIIIGDDITITVVDVRGDKVRLGISAPNTISVHREEIYRAIQRERSEAAVKTPATPVAAAATANGSSTPAPDHAEPATSPAH